VLVETVVAGENDGSAAFASAGEATNPIEANDSVSPNSFFMFHPF
jgi:hypothetical protein